MGWSVIAPAHFNIMQKLVKDFKMKIISWNVAGIRACQKKGFNEFVATSKADIYCLQEVKAKQDQFAWPDPAYTVLLNPAEKAGYSGTLVASLQSPIDYLGWDGPGEDAYEGRVIICEYPKFYLVCCYTPNSQNLLKRLPYRLRWEVHIQKLLVDLDQQKPVIYCGDLNVCHKPEDIHSPLTHTYSPGYSAEERQAMTDLLAKGFVDTWRELHPTDQRCYTYWSYLGNARANNSGWRLDYFILSQRLLPYVTQCEILKDVEGSDHCPILLELDDRLLK